jgi:hypothetical protein
MSIPFVERAHRYLDVVTCIEEFPTNLVAGFFQFRPRACRDLDRARERRVPKVSFGS